jgi:hypothetical protein
MTVTGSSFARRAIAVTLALGLGSGLTFAEESTLLLRAVAAHPAAAQAPVTIELFRWSTDAERTPLLTALAPPPPAPAAPAAAPGAAGRGGRGAPGGRGGRGGRGAAPASPVDRLSAAVKAAPTLGFVWSDSVTGHSIRYAWRTPATGAPTRVVLVTDRRLGAHTPDWAPASGPLADADFTVIEIRLDAKGVGEGKASLTTNVAVDAAAQTLALDGYAVAPTLLKVTR